MKNENKMKMQKICFLTAALLVIGSIGFCQDSTFTLEPAWEFPMFNGKIAASDLENGVQKIYFGAKDNVHDIWHFGTVRGGELLSEFEIEDENEIITYINVADFDGDEITDILIPMEVFPENREIVSIFSIERGEIIFRESFDLGGYRIHNGAEGYDEGGEYRPFLINHHRNTEIIEDENGNLFRTTLTQASLLIGTPVDDQIDSITTVPTMGTITILNNGENQSDYFIAGYSFGSWQENEEYPVDSTYVEFATSYGGSWNEPLKYVQLRALYEGLEDNLTIRANSFSKNSIAYDLDNDGDIEWVVPFTNQSNPNSYTVHVPSYNPENLEITHEYTEQFQGWNRNHNPNFCMGVKTVDINQDGVGELLLAVRGQPIRVLDSRDMSLIMVSDIEILGDQDGFYEIGYFQDDVMNLQLVLYEEGVITAYNLPREWTPLQTSIEKRKKYISQLFSLYPSFPNPFNSTATVSYSLPIPGHASLQVYNPLGQRVATLFDGYKHAGFHSIELKASTLQSGSYFVQMKASNKVFSQKVVVIK